MKISNAEVIKNGEQDLIDAITADLDWEAIEKIFLKEHNLGIEEDIEYKRGDIVPYNDQVAYKLEFEVKVNLSVLLNREGEYISVKIAGDQGNAGDIGGENDQEKGSPETENEAEDKAGDTLGNKDPDETMDQIESINSNDGIEQGNPPPASEEKADAFRDALAELDSEDNHVESETDSYATPDNESDKDMARMETDIGEIMDNISRGPETQSDAP